jgi:hypothetical protein
MIGRGIAKREFPKPDRGAVMRSIPILNAQVELIRDDAGSTGAMLISRRPRSSNNWLARCLIPPVIEKRLKLGELGVFVVNLFDGVRDVATIAAIFATHFKVNRREAELSTALFIKRLAEREMAAIIVPT